MPPRVSIGLPVYNGERYLELALQRLLAQSFGDFELLVADNASLDRTGGICRDYAAKDSRISYHRNASNIGLLPNHNSLIERARGEFYLLAHYDDLRHESYLARTVEILDSDESVVIAHSRTRDIDEQGIPLPPKDPPLRLDSNDLRIRFRDIIRMDHMCSAIFGLTRLAILRQTKLYSNYADSDRVLLAELLLRGRCYEIPENLFSRRWHEAQSTEIAPGRQARSWWLNADRAQRLVFPHFRQFNEYVSAILRAPLSTDDKIWCLGEMLRWAMTNRHRLGSDLDFAARHLLRPFVRAVWKKNSDGSRAG